MTRPEIVRDLTAWARDAGPDEERIKAKDLILEAYDKKETTLHLNRLWLTSLPECIGQLSKLEKLYLRNNQLTLLPDSIGQLSKLETLGLENNRIRTLPESFGQLSKLEKLYLDHNKITTLPESIGQLSNLKWLYLRNNRITTLPESFGQLSNLQELDLSWNQLKTLPKEFCQLSNLQNLGLSVNQITTLPRSLQDFWENRELEHGRLVTTQKTCQEEYGTVTYFDPEPTAQASTSTAPATTVDQPSISTSPRVPLLVSTSFAAQHEVLTANDFHLALVPQGEQALTRMGLPTDLENNPACAHFFADLTRAMCNLHNINAAAAGGYSNTQASPWSRVASALLSNTGIPGVSVLGHLLVSFSRRFNETQAANEANSILGHFIDGEQFGRLTSHIAVRLTQALEPQLGVLLSQPTQDSSNLKAWVNGWKQALGLQPTPIDSPFASLIALVCIKELLETPRADNQTQVRNNYVVQLTDQLVPRVLNSEEIAQALVELPAHNGVSGPEADWTDVHEVSSSTQPPRGSDQPAQPSADEVVDVLDLRQEVHRQRAEINQLRQAVQHQELLGNGRMQRQTHVNVNIIGGHAVAAPHETQRTVTAIDLEARQVVRDTHQRVDYHEARINLLEGALEGSGHNFGSDASSYYPSTQRSGSGSSTNRRRTQMELNRLPRNWMKTEFTLPSMTEISADYLSKHDQVKAAVRFNNSEWQIQKSGKRSILGLSKWPTLSKALQKAHKDAHTNPSSTLYTVQDDLNTLVTNLPKPFNKAANIFDEANQERLKAIVQGVLGRAQNA